MKSEFDITVAFTGHRSYRHEADLRLRQTIEALWRAGRRCFLSGMAMGFDMAAAEAVLELRERWRDLRLVAVVPFRGQERLFPEEEQRRFNRILEAADEVVILSEGYSRGVYAVRNGYLIDHAATIVAWYGGGAGGTRQTVNRALKKGRRLIHLHPSTPLEAYPVPSLF